MQILATFDFDVFIWNCCQHWLTCDYNVITYIYYNVHNIRIDIFVHPFWFCGKQHFCVHMKQRLLQAAQ